jgi:DNA polymerase III subunit epsilon
MDHGALVKTLLHEVNDGVVVCDSEAKIILFNPAAEILFTHSPLLAKGRSLFKLCCRPPIVQALNLLHFQHNLISRSEDVPYIQFMNKVIASEQFLRCRISFLASQSGIKKSFVLILEDISSWFSAEGSTSSKIEEFRAPMTNLRAAVENLTEFPEMSPVMRSGFENVLVQETLNLTAAFNSLDHSCNVLRQMQSHLAELDTKLFIRYLIGYLDKKNLPVSSITAGNSRVKIDIYGLFLILDFLVGTLRKKKSQKEFHCEITTGEQFIFIDFVWPGKFRASGSVKAMLEKKLKNSLGERTVASILHTMEADMWGQQHKKTTSMLRLALPLAMTTDP